MKKQLFALTLVFVIMLILVLGIFSGAMAAEMETLELNVEYDYEAAEKLPESMNSYWESGDAWVLDSKGNRVELGTLTTEKCLITNHLGRQYYE